jgi:hypothetical protein
MAQLRHRRNSGAEAIPRDTLQDGDLSFLARGVLGYALSLPPGWNFSAKRVAASCAAGVKGSGEAAVLSAFKELELAGYRRLVREQNPQGQWSSFAEFAFSPVPEWIEEAKANEAERAQRKKPGPKKLSPAAKAAAKESREQPKAPSMEPQVTNNVLVFPQVAPELGNPGAGMSSSGAARVSAGRAGTREPESRVPGFLRETPTERETHTEGQEATKPSAPSGTGPVCVEEFQEQAGWVIKGAIDQEADLRLHQVDRDKLIARITVLMQRGWTEHTLVQRLSGCTNARTIRPDRVFAIELDKIEVEEPPVGRSQQDGSSLIQRALHRASGLFTTDDWQLTWISTWINRARLDELEEWLDWPDEQILSQVRAEQERTGRPAASKSLEPEVVVPGAAPRLDGMRTSDLRVLAAERAVELGMTTEAAERWAQNLKTWKVLPWLQAEEYAQRDQLPALSARSA